MLSSSGKTHDVCKGRRNNEVYFYKLNVYLRKSCSCFSLCFYNYKVVPERTMTHLHGQVLGRVFKAM